MLGPTEVIVSELVYYRGTWEMNDRKSTLIKCHERIKDMIVQTMEPKKQSIMWSWGTQSNNEAAVEVGHGKQATTGWIEMKTKMKGSPASSAGVTVVVTVHLQVRGNCGQRSIPDKYRVPHPLFPRQCHRLSATLG